MSEPRRLHPAAIAVYSAQALGNFAFPLLIVVGMSLLGGGFDAGALVRSAAWGLIGVVISVVTGFVRWKTTTYWIDESAIHHHSGLLREQDTKVPVDRVEAIDVHQGLLQRWFGVNAVEVQTGAGKKGGEISLPALTPAAVEELRAARPTAAAAASAESTGPQRRLTGRELFFAAVSAGQFGIVLPVLAAGGQVAQQLFEEDGGRDAVRLIPHSETTALAIVAGLVALAWVLSMIGSVVAFAGFVVSRDEHHLRIRRGLIQRRAATVPVGRVRAVRVVEGLTRRPFGLASLHIEVIGYADEASAARTLFPLVRVRDVPAFLGELLPELADDP
jgi:putative membrane protein